LVSLDLAIGVEVGLNQADKFVFKKIFAKGDGYMMSEALENRQDAPIYATAEIELDFANKILSGAFSLDADYELEPVLSLKIDGQKTRGSMLVEMKEGGQFYLKAGRPVERMKAELSAFGTDFTIQNYFQLGKDLDPMPDVADIVPGWPVPAEKIQDRNISPTSGIALGMSLYIEKNYDFAIFYANFRGALGFDVAMGRSNLTCPDGVQVGLDGWMMKGQIFAYAGVDVGMRYDLGLLEGEINILSANIGASLRGQFPNPSVFTGRLAGNYSVLGGLLEGNFNLKFQVASDKDKECLKALISKPNPLAEFPLVADKYPAASEKEVPIFANPQLAYNLHVGKEIRVDDIDENGNDLIRYFKASLAPSEGFVLRKVGSSELIPCRTIFEGKSTTLKPIQMLEPQTKYEISWKLNWQQKQNGVWVNLKNDDGTDMAEIDRLSFTTGALPDVIVKDLLDYHAPGHHQKYWHHGYANTRIKFDKAAPAGSNWQKEYFPKSKEVAGFGRINYDYIIRITRFHNGEKEGVFDLPLSEYPGLKNFQQPVTTYKQIGSLFLIPKVEVKNVQGLNVGFADLDKLITNDAAWKGKLYQLQLIRLPLLPKTQLEENQTLIAQTGETTQNNTKGLVLSGNNLDAAQDYQVKLVKTSLKNRNSQLPPEDGLKVLYEYWFATSKYDNLNKKIEAAQVQALDPSNVSNTHFDHPDDAVDLGFRFKSNAIGLGHFKDDFYGFSPPLEGFDQYDLDRIRLNAIIQYPDKAKNTDIQGVESYAPLADNLLLPDLIFAWEGASRGNRYTNLQRNNSIKTYRKWLKNSVSLSQDNLIRYWKKRMIPPSNHPDWMVNFHLPNQVQAPYLTKEETDNKRLLPYQQYKGKSLWKTASKPLFSQDQTFALVFQDIYSRVRGLQYIALRQSVDGYKSDLDHSFNKANMGKYEDRFRDKWADWFWRGPKDYGFYSPNRYMMKRGDSVQSPWSLVDFKNRYRSLYEGKAIGTQLNSIYYKGKVEISLPILDKWQDMGQSIRQSKDFYPIHRISAYPKRSGTTTPIKTERLQAKEKGGKTFQFSDQVVSSSIYLVDYPRTEALVSLEIKVKKYYKTRKAAALSPNDKKEDFRRVAFWEAKSKELDLYNFSTGKRAIKYGVSLTGEENRAFMGDEGCETCINLSKLFQIPNSDWERDFITTVDNRFYHAGHYKIYLKTAAKTYVYEHYFDTKLSAEDTRPPMYQDYSHRIEPLSQTSEPNYNSLRNKALHFYRGAGVLSNMLILNTVGINKNWDLGACLIIDKTTQQAIAHLNAQQELTLFHYDKNGFYTTKSAYIQGEPIVELNPQHEYILYVAKQGQSHYSASLLLDSHHFWQDKVGQFFEENTFSDALQLAPVEVPQLIAFNKNGNQKELAIPIPGQWSAADFAQPNIPLLKGNGMAYMDKNQSSNNGYRPNDLVEFNPYNQLKNLQAGEWLTYVLNAPTNATFLLKIKATTQNSQGRFNIIIDGKRLPNMPLSFGTYQNNPKLFDPIIELTGGRHELKLEVLDPISNLDFIALVPHQPKLEVTGNQQIIPHNAIAVQLENGTNFGNQPCSDAPPMIFKIANKGLGKIKLRAGVNIQLSGPHAADFKVVSNPKLIALGAHDSTHFAIQFFPTDKNIGLRKAKVQFHYQDDNQSKKEFSFSIQASNYPLQVAFGTENEIFTNSSISGSDDPRNFGNIFDLNKKTKSYTIHNQGNTPIQLNKWLTGDATSEFEIEAFPKQLAANSQHIFKVHYTPNSKSKGIQTVDLNIAPVGCQQSAATLQLSALIAGSALHFDGLDDCIEIANQNQQPIINGGDALTVEYWFKGTNMQSALRFQDGSDFVVAAWQNNRHILSNDGFPEGLATGNATDGNWHHVAFTWERNKENGFKSYLDGQLVDQKKSSNNPLPIIRKGAFLGALNGQSEFMAGTLDEVRIWNRSLSQTELQGRMHCELQGDEFGLRLYYNFNQGIAGIENETINTVNNGQSDQNSGFLQNFELNQSTSNWVSSHHAFSQNEFCSFKMPLMQLSNQAGTILANNAIIPFGRLKAGREKELTFTIRNLGNAPLIFKENALLLSGTHANQFSIRPAFDLTNIPVGEEAIFNIVFTPLDINGDCQAQLKIADHFTLSLQGMAENAVLSLTGNQELINKGSMTARTANHTDFSNQSIGFTTSRLFTIKNEGAMPLQLNDIIISGPDKGSFKVIPPGQKLLQAAESTSFKIAFSPTKKALHKATIHIGNNSTINDTAWSFAVAGTGIAPANVLAFDGLDDYIEAPAGHYFEDNFTIETWLYLSYPNNVYGSSNLLSFSDASNQNKLDIALYKNVHLAITRAGQTQQIQTNEYLPQKKWTHLAISFLDNQAFVYLNGKLWFKGSIQAPKKTLLQNCFIGRSNNAGQLVLDEFRIWNRWLNEKEILARMNCELTGDETGLALYYNFNQGTPAGNNQQVAFIKNNKTAATKQGVLKNFALQTNQSNWLKIANGIAETPCANYQVNPLVIRDGNHQLVTSAASLDFGDIAPNQQASQILELTNISSTALSPTFSFSGEAAKDFSIMNPSLTPIPPKGTAKIKVVFQPKALHNRRASLAIKSPNGNDLWSATLNGYGAKTGATALIFDGQDDYIDLPNANYLGTHFSIETWMAQNYEKSNAIFFNFFDAKGNHIQLTNSSLDISTNGQRQSISLPKLFQNDFDAAWKHIALTVADNQGQLYLNGNLIQSFTINLPTNPNFTNGRIGQNAGIKLDEFRIWKQPLSSQAINVRMNCELEGTEKDLILYYKLNQGLPNGNNGKVTQVENAAANAPFAAFGQLIGFDLKRSNSPIGPISNWIVGESPVNGNCGKEVGTLVLRQVHNAAIIQQNSATESNENPLNLGKIALNKSISLPIEIENASMISVEIAGVQVSGANFADFDLSLPEKHYLQAGETTRFQLSFNPQSAGIKKGKVMLQTNLPNVWWEFDIIGEGLALQPQLVTNLANAKNTIYTGLINQISQNTPINHPFTGKKLANNAVLDLGKGKQGSNPVFTIQLKNEGGKVLNLLDESPIELIGTHSNQFKIYEKGNLTAFSKRQILPLDSLEFDVHFIPDGSCQNCQASLRIQSDDPEGNYMLQLQGQYQATDVKIGLQHQHKNMAHQDTLSIIATVGYDNKEQLILQQVSGKDPLLLTGNPKLVLTGADKAAFDAVLDREWNGGIYTHFVSINFKPSERAGLHHAQLVIPNNDPNTPNYTIHLKGQAKTLQPEINIRPQYYSTIVNNEAANEYTDFGEVHQGDYKDLFFAIVNTGVADLQLTNTPLIKVEGENADEFEVFANSNLTAFNTATLAPNEEQNFLVRFTPNGNTGDKTAYLSVLNNDADEGNYIIHLKGHGLLAAPEIDLQDQAGNSIDNEAVANKNTDFGSVKKGSYKDLTFTIANMGKGPLYLQGNPKIKLVGPHAAQFSIQSDQQLETIPAGSSSNFTIRYTPISEQEVTAQIIIATNDEDASNFTINLKGKGIPGILANSGTALHFNTGQNRIHIEGSYQMDINNWSIECYLKPEKAGSFLEQDLSSGSLKFFIDNQAQLQLEHISWSSNWKQNKYTLGQLTWNQWQHIAIVKSANSLQIYLNGELHKSLTTAPMSSSNSNFNLGKGESRNSFAGAIDELRIWNQALSQTTIMQRKDCELKGDEQGLLGYYDFNQGQAGLDNTNTFEESTYTHPWTQAVTVYKNFYALDRTKAFNRKSTMYHFKFKNQQSNWIKGGSPVKIGVHCAK
jgi:hypothetical protein